MKSFQRIMEGYTLCVVAALITVTLTSCSSTADTAAARGLSWYQENTGVPASQDTVSSESLTVTEDGKVIEGLDVRGDITVQANDVTIRNSRIEGMIHNEGSNLLIDHVEMDGTTLTTEARDTYPAISYTGFTLTNSNIHDFAQGVSAAGNVTIADSWLHGLRSNGQHAEPIVSNGGSDMNFQRNWLDSTDTNAYTHVSAALALYGDFAQIRNVVVDGNYMVGAGYLTYTGAAPGKPYPVPENVAYTNNTFDTSAPNCYGPVNASPMDTTSVQKWRRNVLPDGTEVPPPEIAS